MRADYAFSAGAGGTLLVTGIGGGFSAVDTLSNIETLAFADAFRAIMAAFAVATVLVPLMRNVTPKPLPADAH